MGSCQRIPAFDSLVEKLHDQLHDFSGNQTVFCRGYLGHFYICIIDYALYVPIFLKNRVEIILADNYLSQPSNQI